MKRVGVDIWTKEGKCRLESRHDWQLCRVVRPESHICNLFSFHSVVRPTCAEYLKGMSTFTRAPHQAGRSLQQTMNQHFFFSLLAPRLPHVVQGKEDTDDSGCAAEVHHGRVGEESSGGVQLSHGARFLWTAHLDANDIAVRPEHFVLVQEEVDVETVQAMRPTTLVLHVLLELQNEALFKLLAVRASERRRGRAPAPAPAW